MKWRKNARKWRKSYIGGTLEMQYLCGLLRFLEVPP